MKRALIITAAVAIIALLVGLWLYLLLSNNAERDGGIFAVFDFGGADEPPPLPPLEPRAAETPVVNLERQPLRQLTTRPVIGFREVLAEGAPAAAIHYVEAGTGHLYAIDLETGLETRLSGTTVPLASRAFLSRDGRFAVIRSGAGRGQDLTIGTIDREAGMLVPMTFTEPVHDFTLTDEDELLYTIRTATSTVGRVFNLRTERTRTLFTVPFRETRLVWGRSADDTHYVHPRPSSLLKGYLYRLRGGVMSRVPGASGYGLTAFGQDELVFFNTQTDGFYEGMLFLRPGGWLSSPIPTLAEKCTFETNSTSTLWCAWGELGAEVDFPDSWYRGEWTFSDALWKLGIEENFITIEPALDLSAESGRALDVLWPLMNETNERLYFKNKSDRTLWVYERHEPNQ